MPKPKSKLGAAKPGLPGGNPSSQLKEDVNATAHENFMISPKKHRVLARMIEMFSSALDEEIIEDVAQSCNYKFTPCFEALVMINAANDTTPRTSNGNRGTSATATSGAMSLSAQFPVCPGVSSSQSSNFNTKSRSPQPIPNKVMQSPPKTPTTPQQAIPRSSASKPVQLTVLQRTRHLIQNNVKLIVLMRGLPGSGKSHVAQQLYLLSGKKGQIFSADDYFTRPSGDYHFRRGELTEAHNYTRKQVVTAMINGTRLIIVDNTNTETWEMSPFVAMAMSYKYHLELLEPETEWRNNLYQLLKRNKHKVPLHTLEKMQQRYEYLNVDQLLKKLNYKRTFQFSDEEIICMSLSASEKVSKCSTSPRKITSPAPPVSPSRPPALPSPHLSSPPQSSKVPISYASPPQTSSESRIDEDTDFEEDDGSGSSGGDFSMKELDGYVFQTTSNSNLSCEENFKMFYENTKHSTTSTSAELSKETVASQSTSFAANTAPNYKQTNVAEPVMTKQLAYVCEPGDEELKKHYNPGEPQDTPFSIPTNAAQQDSSCQDSLSHNVTSEQSTASISSESWEETLASQSTSNITNDKQTPLSEPLMTKQSAYVCGSGNEEFKKHLKQGVNIPSHTVQQDFFHAYSSSHNVTSGSQEEDGAAKYNFAFSPVEELYTPEQKPISYEELYNLNKKISKAFNWDGLGEEWEEIKQEDIEASQQTPSKFVHLHEDDNLKTSNLVGGETSSASKGEENGIENHGQSVLNSKNSFCELKCQQQLSEPPSQSHVLQNHQSESAAVSEITECINLPSIEQHDKEDTSSKSSFGNCSNTGPTGVNNLTGNVPSTETTPTTSELDCTEKTSCSNVTPAALESVSIASSSRDKLLEAFNVVKRKSTEEGASNMNLRPFYDQHNNLDSDETDPPEDDVKINLSKLQGVFPQISVDGLSSVLDECHGNVDWAIEMLLHSHMILPDSIESLASSSSLAAKSPEKQPKSSSPKSGSQVSSPSRKEKQQSKEALELKRMLEMSVKLNKEHYSNRIVQCKHEGAAPGVKMLPFLSPPPPPPKTPDHPPEADSIFVSDEEDEEDEAARDSPVQIKIDKNSAERLLKLFGGPLITQMREFSADDLIVKLPPSIARQIHIHWLETLQRRFDEKEEQFKQLLKDDELVARRMQQMQNEQPPQSLEGPALPSDVPDLKEIMEMEKALGKIVKNDQKEGFKNNMATKLSRQLLGEQFPRLDPQAIDAVFDAHNRNYQETVDAILASFGGDSSVSTVMSPEAISKHEQQLIEQARQENLKMEAEIQQRSRIPQVVEVMPSKIASNLEEDRQRALEEVQKYREEAKTHRIQRFECYQKANKALRQGMRGVASYYSEVGLIHKQKMELANSAAAACLFGVSNNKTLDLHYLYVSEALEVLDVFLDHHAGCLAADRNGGKTSVELVTGRGLRSEGGKSRLKPAVIYRLKQRGLRYDEINPGALRVYLTRNMVMSGNN